MTETERDIRSTPAIIKQTMERVLERGDLLGRLLGDKPVVFLGCGSSYCIGAAAASYFERLHGIPADAVLASEYVPRPGCSHIAITRTGKTTELIEAMRRARRAGAPVGLLLGEPGAPAEAESDVSLHMEFAPEQGVIQTRFVTAATVALFSIIGGGKAREQLNSLPSEIGQALDAHAFPALSRFAHVVFLGRGYRYGLARAASLNLQETALSEPSAHQTLEYRHGPIAAAGPDTLVWCFDKPGDNASAAVLEEVRRTGATLYNPATRALASLVEAQLAAVEYAVEKGLDPDAPQHLSRAIVLPESAI
jgi:glucosamine--fructose-6-phosphate aminotransferase (isomerizing)